MHHLSRSDVLTLPVRVRRGSPFQHAHSHRDIRPVLLVLPLSRGVTAQQDHPCNQEDQERGEAHVQRLSDLTLLRLQHHGVIKVSYDGMSGPADGNESGEAGRDEKTPAHQQDHILAPTVVLKAVCAPHPADGHQDGEDGERDGHTHEPAGRLDVSRQDEQRVVDLALHPDVRLPNARHPQPLPLRLHDDEVGPDKRRDLPHGERGHCDGPDQPDGAQHQGQDLQFSPHVYSGFDS